MKARNVIALLLFIGAVVYVLMMPSAITRMWQDRVMSLLAPFIRAGAETEQGVKNVVQSPVDVAALQRDNERLQQEVAKLRVIAQKYDQVSVENNKFRTLLSYQKSVNFKLTAAHVIRRSASNWWNTLIIDKGTEDGVSTDFPVITDVGMVGKVGKVVEHTAEVLLLTDEECRVASRIEGTLAKGILTGARGGLETRPDLRLRF
jgi:rod shape-determining protein MreC